MLFVAHKKVVIMRYSKYTKVYEIPNRPQKRRLLHVRSVFLLAAETVLYFAVIIIAIAGMIASLKVQSTFGNIRTCQRTAGFRPLRQRRGY